MTCILGVVRKIINVNYQYVARQQSTINDRLMCSTQAHSSASVCM